MSPDLSRADEANTVRMLEAVPLFSSLDKKSLKGIAKASTLRKYGSGVTIEEEGDFGITFYLVKSGNVDVRKGKRKLASLGPGEFFGEMALFNKQPRSASVITTEPTECLLMTSWNFLALVETQPKLAVAMLKELAKRLRESDKSLSE
jgi:CRP/FNR family transcriptional regulator, cyclic AMP receptor protein